MKNDSKLKRSKETLKLLYTVHVIPKHGISFHYEDCTFDHATRLKEINERVWNGDATITIVKQ